MRQWKKWISLIIPSTHPFPGLTVKCQMFPQRSPLAVKRVIKVTERLHKMTSWTITGLICVIILLWQQHLTWIKTLHTSAFYVFQLTEKSRLARQHMLPSRAIIKNHHSPKQAEFLALIDSKPNRNKRRRDSDGIVSSPSSRQKSIADYRGLRWGKPGQPVSNKEMDDDIVDYFVGGMVPLGVSSVSVFIPPPPSRAILFFGNFWMNLS